MNIQDLKKSKKDLAIKIVIPILLIAVVIGIWAVKNNQKAPDSLNTNKTDTVVPENSASKETGNTDFDLHVTQKIDLQKLKSYGLPIVIDFGADSCIPCKEMAPVLEELNKELKGKAIVKFVDVWKYQDYAEGYPISLIPTQIFIDANGKPFNPKDPEAMQLKMFTSNTNGEHLFTLHQGGMTKEQILSALKEMGLK
jgi:thioredoxin 1